MPVIGIVQTTNNGKPLHDPGHATKHTGSGHGGPLAHATAQADAPS
ncbi:hypothetical protein BTHE_0241 [Bifidobacterium thermophilum]|nr:hypothetical protein BTHE_0241 [Bifidobacterium thermophilum]